MCVRVCVRVCACASACVYMCMCVCVCVRVWPTRSLMHNISGSVHSCHFSPLNRRLLFSRVHLSRVPQPG